MTDSYSPAQEAEVIRWRDGKPQSVKRDIPEESAVAFTYNRTTHAVMMSTPADLEDFAIGFSLSERIVGTPEEIEALEIVPADNGIELRMSIAAARVSTLLERRRYLAGATGCGLCGLESLDEALRPLPQVPPGLTVSRAMVADALAALPPAQRLNRRTSAVHAAALWSPSRGLVSVREDIGRHNALDKLAGCLARAKVAASDGIVVLTSRVSVEMVQKAALMQAPVIVAVSAPTALAVRSAHAAGITLIAIARADGFEVFTHSARLNTD